MLLIKKLALGLLNISTVKLVMVLKKNFVINRMYKLFASYDHNSRIYAVILSIIKILRIFMRSYCCHIWPSIGTIFTQYIKNYNLGGLESVIMQKKRLIKCIR